MRYTRLLALIAGATLALTAGLAAQNSSSSAAAKTDNKVKAATSTLKGAVKSITNNEIVVQQKNKELKFSLNSETQKEGDIKPGSEVTVQFRFEDMKDVATRIQAVPTKNKKGD